MGPLPVAMLVPMCMCMCVCVCVCTAAVWRLEERRENAGCIGLAQERARCHGSVTPATASE